MAKKKSKFKEIVETVESWVGMGPKAEKTAKKKTAKKKTAKKSSPKTAKKGGTNVKKATKKVAKKAPKKRA